MSSALVDFPVTAPRTVRRSISRDLARATARYGIPGQPTGPRAHYPRPARPRPASTRSGQARINHKRNQRAAFREHLIALRVSAQLADLCDIEQYLNSLVGRVVRRQPEPTEFAYIYWLDAPGAPAEAASMTPTFYCRDDGTVSRQSIEWRRADGTLIHDGTERTRD